WRVTGMPPASRVIDAGPPSHSRRRTWSRVSSPSAANTGAARSRCGLDGGLRRRAVDIPLDVAHLFVPALFVAAIRGEAAVGGDAIEAGLDHEQLGAAVRGIAERED